MTFHQFWTPLRKVYDDREARAVAQWILEVCFGFSMADILEGALEKMDEGQQRRLDNYQQQLLQGIPVQYVAGIADFGPRTFIVAPGVLIPRPETYQLCRWILDDCRPASCLDIGTGSGCIACTLAAELPSAHVTAWDISDDALAIARENARRHQVNIDFRQCDILIPPLLKSAFSLIVSNPPYICRKEAAEMSDHVLDYEPETALFVPDEDPLLFYRAISRFATQALQPGGRLYFEINPLYQEETARLLTALGFREVGTHEDQYGKTRFINAIWT